MDYTMKCAPKMKRKADSFSSEEEGEEFRMDSDDDEDKDDYLAESVKENSENS